MELKTQDARLEIKAVTEKGEFEGFGSVFDVLDFHNEIVVRGAFEKSLHEKGAKGIKFLDGHDSNVRLGVFDKVEEQDRGLFVKGRFNLEKQVAREAHSDLKMGAVDGLSIGFMTVKSEDDHDTGVRRLTEIDLWEVSLVTFAANPQSSITAVKSAIFRDLPLAPLATKWSVTRAMYRLKKLTIPNDRKGFASAHAWADPGKHTDEYLLPIGDVIDGEIKAVPAAIFAAAAAIEGARTDNELPETARVALRKHLSRYFVKMRKEFKDDTIKAPWDDGANHFRRTLKGVRGLLTTTRQFERFLRDAGFSRSDAEAITLGGFKTISPHGDRDGDHLEGEPRDDSGIMASLVKARNIFNPK